MKKYPNWFLTKNQPSFKIKEMARKNGMMTMLEDGLQKALDGKTSLHELIEVLGSTRDV